MKVLNQDASIKNMEISNLRSASASARTRHLMVSTAIEVMQKGMTPSVSELGKIAGVSRATAYRYFPGQSDLVAAVVRLLNPVAFALKKTARANPVWFSFKPRSHE